MAVKKKRAAAKPAKAGLAAKIGKPAAAAPAPKSRKGTWITLGLLLLLGGFVAQAFFLAKEQASLKFDVMRVGPVISQGLADGQATGPTDITGGPDGSIYIIDGVEREEPRLQRFDAMMAFVERYKPRNAAELFGKIVDASVDGKGNLYVLEQTGNVKVIDKDLRFQRNMSTPVSQPAAIAVDDEGTLYISTRADNKVVVADNKGQFIAEFGAPGTKTGDLAAPTRLEINAKGDLVVMEELAEGLRMKVFGKDLRLKKTFRVPDISMCPPLRIGSDNAGRIYINDHQGSRGVVVHDTGSGKLVGEMKSTTDNIFFISPGAVGANRFTGRVYVHSVPGLVQAMMPEGK